MEYVCIDSKHWRSLIFIAAAVFAVVTRIENIGRRGPSKMARQKKAAGQVPPWPIDPVQVETSVSGVETISPWWTLETRAQWVFEFLRTDLESLTPGQLLGMRVDVWNFAQPDWLITTWGTEKFPPLETLKNLQADANAGLQRVDEGQWFELQQGISYGIARQGGRIVRGCRKGSLEDLFRADVMDIVQMFWEQLHKCPRCQARFLKVGKRKYCSLTCSSRVHWDAFKARRKRDHHGEYVGRARKRTSPKVQVAKRPRRAK